MISMDSYLIDGPLDFPADPEPNLITGVGHGHCRPLWRHKAEANHAKKLKKARKMTKRSRRRNRKGC